MYCFIPSYEADKGTAYAFDHRAEFLKEFQFYTEIQRVTFDHIGGNNSRDKSNKGRINGINNSNQGKMGGCSKFNQKKMYECNKSNQTRITFNDKSHKKNVKSQHGIGQGASPGQKGGQKLRYVNQSGSDVRRKLANNRSEKK